MRVGIVKEVKDHEYRVGATPAMVAALKQKGGEILVETGAGAAIGYSDEEYRNCGAQIVSCEEAWSADLIYKVKEPQLFEVEKMRKGAAIYAFLHLAAEPKLTDALLEKQITAIAFETITCAKGRLPLLASMSAIAGRVGAHMGAQGLHKVHGGCGRLIGSVPGVLPAKALVIGAGIAGSHALSALVGMGADVTIMDLDLNRLDAIQKQWGSCVKTLYSTKQALEQILQETDLVVIGVLIAGDKAPKLITRSMLRKMQKGSVIVDISIDQGGVCESSRPTTHSNPFYVEEDVVHYCVSNIPGAVARTSTEALGSVTLPHALALVEKGIEPAIHADKQLRQGVNVRAGRLTHRAIARALEMEYDEGFHG